MSDIADFGTTTKKPDDIADFGATNQQQASDIADFGLAPSLSSDMANFDQAQAIVDQSKNPADTMARANASIAISQLTALSPLQVERYLEPISDKLWPGQPNKPANIVERFVNSIRALELNHEKNQIGARMAMGIEKPRDVKRLAEINASLPAPDETLKMIPNAILSFAYSNIYQPAKAIAIGNMNLNDPDWKVAANVALSLVGGFYISLPAVRLVGEMTEQTAGAAYISAIEAGMDRPRALGISIALTAISTAANTIPMARAATAGVSVAKEAAQEAVKRSLLSGVVVRALTAAGEQSLYGYGLTAADKIAPEIAKASQGLPTKDFWQLMGEIGIEGTLATGIGATISTASIAGSVFSIRRGGAIDLALKEQARKIETPVEPTKPVAEGAPVEKPYVPPAPGEQKIGDILAITDKQAEQFSAATIHDIRMAYLTSNPEFAKNPEATAKQIAQTTLDEYKTKLEARQLTASYINRIEKVDTSKMRPEFAAPVEEIKKNFTAEHFSKGTVARLNDLRSKLAADPNMALSEKEMHQLGEMDKTPYKDLSVDDLKLITESVEHYRWLNLTENQIVIAGRQWDIAHAAAQIEAEAKPLVARTGGHRNVKAEAGPVTRSKEAVQATYDNVRLRSEHVDLVAEEVGPTFRKATVDRALQASKDHYAYVMEMQAESARRVASITEQVGNLDTWFNDTKTLPMIDENGQTVNVDVSRDYIISAYMDTLNPDNARHQTDGGYGLAYSGRDEVNKVYRLTPEAITEINRMVEGDGKTRTPEMIYVDMLRWAMDKTGGDRGEVFLQQNMLPYPKVDNYWRIDTMPVGRKATAKAEAVAMEAKAAYASLHLDRSANIERTDSSIPIYWYPARTKLASSIEDSSKYIHFADPIRQANSVLKNEKVNAVLNRTPDGEIKKNIITKALKDLIGQHDAKTDFDIRFGQKVRNNFSTAVLGAKLAIPGRQFGALLRYRMYISDRYWVRGLVDSFLHPKITERLVREGSPGLYAVRQKLGRSREVGDVQRALGNVGRPKKISEKIKGATMVGIGWADTRGVVRPGMRGAYLQAMDELKAGKLSPDMVLATGLEPAKLPTDFESMNTAAWKFAEWVTERTQTSANPLLQADYERGSELAKAMTLFFSEPFTTATMRRRAYFEMVKQKSWTSKVRFARIMVLTLGVEQIINTEIDRLRDLVNQRPQDRFPHKEIAGMVAAPFSAIPGVAEIARTATNKLIIGWQAQGYDVTPTAQLFQTAQEFILMTADRRTYTSGRRAEKFVDKALELFGYLTGLPVRTPYKAVERAINLGKKIAGGGE